MKVTGIITEYNPFHQGHQYHLEKSRKITSADYVIAVMSGDFVQRGTPALLSKQKRTEMALRSGADLVLELPVSYASGSAEFFAEGAIALLDSLYVVTDLCFGSESGSLEDFQSIARILSREPASYQKTLQEALRSGVSFPAARSAALCDYLHTHPEICSLSSQSPEEFLSTPNNILGLEYCKALFRRDSSIQPHIISRQGQGYHSAALEEYASATGVRRELLKEKPDWIILSVVLPRESYRILQEEYQVSYPVTEDDFSLLLRYRLMLETEESLCRFLDVTPDLARRIKNRENEFTTFSAFANLLKTKEVTYTRICRTLLHILLNLKERPTISCARVLGMRAQAGPLLEAIQKNSSIPLVQKPVQADSLLDSGGITGFRQDLFASNLYESVACQKFSREFTHEFQKPLVIV